ncbi:hypothetical protein B7486_53590 [cyanobacterium TDX16]|nr:hypothetical protein B7486_53590 [cyanobacterium TDX16]
MTTHEPEAVERSPAPEHEPLAMGGQAVIEGVMMRGPTVWAVARRLPDETIVHLDGPVPTWAQSVRSIPVARGAVALVETMALGLRALRWSAAQEDEDGGEAPSDRRLALTTAIVLLVFTAVFAVVPAAVARAFTDLVDVSWLFGPAEAVLRLGLFVGYVLLIGRSPAVRRTFQYHGAEHMAISAYEHGAPLTTESLRRFSTRHARCGTDFLLLVVVVSVVVFSIVPSSSWPVLVATRVVGLPLVAGLAYEVLRLARVRPNNPVVHLLTAPGLALQALTTRPPDDDQLEVAAASLELVLSLEPDSPSPSPAPSEDEGATQEQTESGDETS